MDGDHIRDTAAHFHGHITGGGRIEIETESTLCYARIICQMCREESTHSYAFEQRRTINFIKGSFDTWYVHGICCDKFMKGYDEAGLVLACETEQKVWLMTDLLGDARWVVGAHLNKLAQVPGAVFERMRVL